MKWILFLVGFVAISEGADFDSSEFRFHKVLESENETEGLVRFEIDTELFQHTADRFRDVRLVSSLDGKEFEVPYLISRMGGSAPARPSQRIQTEVISFEENPDGSIEFEIRLDQERSAATLELQTPLRNFEKSVTVLGSQNTAEWKTLVHDALIFDRDRFLDFRRTSVALPDNEARFFRVRISDATDEQQSVVREISRSVAEQSGTRTTETATVATRTFRIDDVRFLTAPRDPIEPDDKRNFPVEIETRVERSGTKDTEIVLATFRTPVNSLTFSSPDKNFRREVRVQIPSNSHANDWRTIRTSRIHRYHIGEFHHEDLTVVFDAKRVETLRVLIENGDSPPLAIDEIIATGDRYEALFLAEPGSEWSLYYGKGHRTAESPRYDLAALNMAKDRNIPAKSLSLGEERKNPNYDDHHNLLDWAEQKWALWLAISVVVASLTLVLFRTGRKMEPWETES